ncbi:MAG: glutathionylspermidine synthase family protein [Isosphaeraceae bacterium]|nr:glutathionylspermidine synthase family protein [Isosphaeraceae bacterium]
MLRIPTSSRPRWQERVESKGLTFHTLDGEPYWDESAYYLFESREIDAIEAATQQLHELCLKAVEHVIRERRLAELTIPAEFHPFIEQSWERDERSIYGRFDLSYDGAGPPKMLEYNADTPTALLEAAVIQWFWLEDLRATMPEHERHAVDQFNSIHEALIDAWKRVRAQMGPAVWFSGLGEPAEDLMTVTYLRDTAIQAGLVTEFLEPASIGWDARRGVFTDLRERAIPLLFKLYPWEWLIQESFGRFLPNAPTRWLEPPWKMVLSNKAILAILWELFPDCPYLLEARFEPFGDSYVIKPILSREGANVTILHRGEVVAETDGEYGEAAVVYQALAPLPEFAGRYPVLGSWIVDGESRGLGIREDASPITSNFSRFLPHIFRKQAHVKPPGFGVEGKAKATPAGGSGALWDKWLDP